MVPYAIKDHVVIKHHAIQDVVQLWYLQRIPLFKQKMIYLFLVPAETREIFEFKTQNF